MNRKIGLYGGFFNPLHEGHVHVIESSIKSLNLKKLFILPTYQNPLKANQNLNTINSQLSNKDLQKFLNENSWKIRKGLSDILPLKKVPELRFIYDDHIDNVRKIDDLIEKL